MSTDEIKKNAEKTLIELNSIPVKLRTDKIRKKIAECVEILEPGRIEADRKKINDEYKKNGKKLS